jgi:phage gpG-like protein
MSVKMTKDRLPQLIAQIGALTKRETLVGIPSATATRKDNEPINNAQIGFIQEFGSPANNIPARPFLIPGVTSVKERIAEELERGARSALTGTPVLDEAFHRVGLVAQNAVRAKINNGPFAPLAESTITQRLARGRTGTKPLIDTGQLRNSITYAVRNKVK